MSVSAGDYTGIVIYVDSVLYTFIIIKNERPKILLNFTDLLMNMLDFQFALDLILVEK